MRDNMSKFPAIRIAIALALCAAAHAQGLNPNDLLRPPADSWPGYHGDYSGRRHSSLTQITPSNVEELGLSWIFQTRPERDAEMLPPSWSMAFSTSPCPTTSGPWMRAPAIRSGITTYPQNKGFHIGSRGVSM